MRDFIWAHPQAFAWTLCVFVSLVGVAFVVACFSVKQKDDGE